MHRANIPVLWTLQKLYSPMLLITNARIASENSPDLTQADVLLADGKIQQIGKGLTAPKAPASSTPQAAS